MEFFIENKSITLTIVLSVALVLFIVEKIFPLRQQNKKLIPRLTVNIIMAGLTFFTANLLVRPSAFLAMNWGSQHSFGILNVLELPLWIEIILGFLLLDLSFYYWHVLNHKWPFFWRFHNVHHLDPDLDISTGFRFHFGEVAFSAIFRGVQVLIIGPTLGIFLAYEFVFQMCTFFHHSNLNLPRTLDRWINFVFVTPRMHGIHHSQVRTETDSNYSVVFSLWDRVHKSFNQDHPQNQIVIGVPGYASEEDNKLLSVILAPFKKQKKYWR